MQKLAVGVVVMVVQIWAVGTRASFRHPSVSSPFPVTWHAALVGIKPLVSRPEKTNFLGEQAREAPGGVAK